MNNITSPRTDDNAIEQEIQAKGLTAPRVTPADDLFVPDVSTTVTISVQPSAQTAVAGAATFAVTAAVSPAGTATYQWQSKAAGSSKWTAVTGETGASLVLAGQTVANSGDQYRVVVAGEGAKAVISTAAALTVAA